MDDITLLTERRGYPEEAHFAFSYTPVRDEAGYAPVAPEGAFYDEGLGEFLLPYEAVRSAPDPDRALLAFLQSTYVAAADLGAWDRAALEAAPSGRTISG